MAQFQVVRVNFSPATVGSNETTTIYTAPKGTRVLSASIRAITPAASSTSSTIQVGDGSDTDGFITTADLDLESAAGTIAAGTGAYVDSTQTGKLYTAEIPITATYTANTPGATTPVVGIALTVVREWPRG